MSDFRHNKGRRGVSPRHETIVNFGEKMRNVLCRGLTPSIPPAVMSGNMMNSETTSKSPFEEASEAWERGEVDIALKLFLQGAKVGDESCQLNLGFFFDEGIAGEKNKKKAIYWYRKAYKAGCSSAASNIGTVYRDAGEYKKALWWFRRGLAMGDCDALLEIGKLYEKGLGIRKNPEKARSYYTKILAVAEGLVTEDTREQATKRLRT